MACFEPRDERVELQARYDLDRELLARGIATYVRGLPTVRRVRIVLVAMGILVAATAALMLPAPTGYIVGAAYLLLMLVLAMRRVTRITRSAMDLIQPEAAGLIGEHLVQVGATTIVSADKASRTQRRLEYVHALARQDGVLLIYMTPGSPLVVPATADFGRDSFETFVSKLEELYRRARGGPADPALRP